MDYCYSLSLPKSPGLHFLSSPLKSKASRNFRPPTIVASAGPSHCDFSSLNTPHQPCSPVGKFLTGVLLNHRQLFNVAVAGELKLLAQDRDATVSRLLFCSADEACLHRRIAQMKHHEFQVAIEDVMYVLILSKFSDIGVPLVPELSKCIYNGRLELFPSKDWELESIYGFEALEMVKEHVSTMIGLRTDSSVTDNWTTTEIHTSQLGQFYSASVLYGYFLQSVSLRHNLEQGLSMAHLVSGHVRGSIQSSSLDRGSSMEIGSEKLRGYVLGFDPETLQRCAKVRSKEAMNLIEIHSSALFGDEKKGVPETDEMILTSFSSMKRLALEAVAFGSFLWDIERYVGSMYTLEENI